VLLRGGVVAPPYAAAARLKTLCAAPPSAAAALHDPLDAAPSSAPATGLGRLDEARNEAVAFLVLQQRKEIFATQIRRCVRPFKHNQP
jgi:hypothetical protein